MEEHNFDDCESIKGLSEFTKWVEAFCVSNKIIEYKDSEHYDYIVNMPHEDILSLSSDECFANALTLMNYAGILQKKHDLIDSQYQWCTEAMNTIYAKYWDRYSFCSRISDPVMGTNAFGTLSSLCLSQTP